MAAPHGGHPRLLEWGSAPQPSRPQGRVCSPQTCVAPPPIPTPGDTGSCSFPQGPGQLSLCPWQLGSEDSTRLPGFDFLGRKRPCGVDHSFSGYSVDSDSVGLGWDLRVCFSRSFHGTHW